MQHVGTLNGMARERNQSPPRRLNINLRYISAIHPTPPSPRAHHSQQKLTAGAVRQTSSAASSFLPGSTLDSNRSKRQIICPPLQLPFQKRAPRHPTLSNMSAETAATKVEVDEQGLPVVEGLSSEQVKDLTERVVKQGEY